MEHRSVSEMTTEIGDSHRRSGRAAKSRLDQGAKSKSNDAPDCEMEQRGTKRNRAALSRCFHVINRGFAQAMFQRRGATGTKMALKGL